MYLKQGTNSGLQGVEIKQKLKILKRYQNKILKKGR